MLFLLAMLILAATCALPVMYAWHGEAAANRRTMTGDDKEATDPRPPQPESLEGVLVAQLAADEISRRQYQRAMAKLAARDDERRPLSVPPEQGPAV